eukprot:1707503-Prymnesium_polylepis.2
MFSWSCGGGGEGGGVEGGDHGGSEGGVDGGAKGGLGDNGGEGVRRGEQMFQPAAGRIFALLVCQLIVPSVGITSSGPLVPQNSWPPMRSLSCRSMLPSVIRRGQLHLEIS